LILGGKNEFYGSSLPRAAIYLDPSANFLHQFPGGSQSEAQTSPLGRGKVFKNIFQLLYGNTRAAVGKFDENQMVIFPGDYYYFPLPADRFNPVGDDILTRPFQDKTVGLDPGILRLEFFNPFQLIQGVIVPIYFQYFGDKPVDFDLDRLNLGGFGKITQTIQKLVYIIEFSFQGIFKYLSDLRIIRFLDNQVRRILNILNRVAEIVHQAGGDPPEGGNSFFPANLLGQVSEFLRHFIE
jgi:hypothetical protein